MLSSCFTSLSFSACARRAYRTYLHFSANTWRYATGMHARMLAHVSRTSTARNTIACKTIKYKQTYGYRCHFEEERRSVKAGRRTKEKSVKAANKIRTTSRNVCVCGGRGGASRNSVNKIDLSPPFVDVTKLIVKGSLVILDRFRIFAKQINEEWAK